jgi:putative membrane protein (TIGR04086 family)
MEKKLLRFTKEDAKMPTMFLLKCLLFSYILTGSLLLLLALLLYLFNLPSQAVAACIILIYVGSTFFAGFMAGRKLKTRKYLWGFILGLAYFILLLLMSLLVNRSFSTIGETFLSTMVLCAGGGTLGGMMS